MSRIREVSEGLPAAAEVLVNGLAAMPLPRSWAVDRNSQRTIERFLTERAAYLVRHFPALLGPPQQLLRIGDSDE